MIGGADTLHQAVGLMEPYSLATTIIEPQVAPMGL